MVSPYRLECIILRGSHAARCLYQSPGSVAPSELGAGCKVWLKRSQFNVLRTLIRLRRCQRLKEVSCCAELRSIMCFIRCGDTTATKMLHGGCYEKRYLLESCIVVAKKPPTNSTVRVSRDPSGSFLLVSRTKTPVLKF